MNPRGETALWQSVLHLAVEDALIGVPSTSGISRKDRVRLTEEARDWLTRPSADLTTICNLAGLDPQAVMERMRARLATAPDPETLIAQGQIASRPVKPKKAKAKRKPFANVPLTAKPSPARSGPPASASARPPCTTASWSRAGRSRKRSR